MEYINAWFFGYIALGVLVGFLAGLLGIGGGMTMVPIPPSCSRRRVSRSKPRCR